MACQCELAPSAESVAIDRGDHRLSEILDPVEHRLPSLRKLPPAPAVQAAQFPDVGPRDERFLPRTGEYDDIHRRVVLEGGKALAELGFRLSVEGVQFLRAVHRDRRYPTGHVCE